MSFETTSDNSVVIVTHAAAQKIYDLILNENNTDLKLRIKIEGGGCSGFQYKFELQDTFEEDDTLIEKQLDNSLAKIHVLIDPLSYQYLLGAEIDYVETIHESKFVIRNPNSKTTCGCGSSFNV